MVRKGPQVKYRLSSAAFEATPVFAEAKMGGGSNARCNDLLCGNSISLQCNSIFNISLKCP